MVARSSPPGPAARSSAASRWRVLLVAGAAIAVGARLAHARGLEPGRPGGHPRRPAGDVRHPRGHDPPELIPVINITSAQLILGADVKATSVDQEVVDEQTPGIPIGILGAPQTLPRPDRFIETGWTACTDDSVGIAVDVSERPEGRPHHERGAIVVQSAGGHWLIATSSSSEGKQQRAYRYPISDDEGDHLLVDYDLGQKAEAINVPPAWLALFPEGGEIGPAGFDLPHFGAGPADPPGARRRVGDYLVLGDGRAPWSSTAASAAGPVRAGGAGEPRPATRRPARGGRARAYAESTYIAAHWPDTALKPLELGALRELDVAAGQAPRVWLAGTPTGDAVSPSVAATATIPADERNVTLDRGHGAFVQVGTWDSTASDSVLVVDPLGKAYPLIGGPATLDKLGYDKDDGTGRPRRVGQPVRRGGPAVDGRRALPAVRPARQAEAGSDCQAPPQ